MAITMFGLVANSQNFVVDETNDTIDVTATWYYDTVFVDTSLIILDDVTLTIDPGTVVMFNGFHKFKVEGTLLSEGTETDTIKYTVADTTGYFDFSHTGWDGINFDTTGVAMENNDTSRFSYSAFYFAKEVDDESQGGAIRILYYSGVTIDNCLFKYNYAAEAGGAISVEYESAPVISNCIFLNNNALQGGGAINIGCYNDEFLIDQPVVKNCYFANNKTWYDSDTYYGGGALKVSGYSDAYIYNNVFENNTSLSQGGAMIVSGYAHPYIVNNLFVGNYAEHNGGAVGLKYYAGGYHLNNTVVDNYANNDGGAYSIGCDNDSCFFANNIIYGNTDLDNDYDQFYIDSEDENKKFYNNNIEGGFAYTLTVNADNIDQDPLMLDYANGDYRLACNSPCKDMSKDTLNYFPDFDLLGMPRLVDVGYDLGAFEIQNVALLDLGEDVSICVGNTTIIDAGAGYESYLWSTTDDTQTIEVSVADTYSVTVANEYLCETTDEIALIVNSLPVVDLGEDQTINNTQSIDLDAGEFEEYLWSTDETTQTITVDGTALGVGVYDYSVTVTDVNTCEGVDEIQITVEDAVGVNDANVEAAAIYPNPNNGVFTVKSEGNIQIVDITGRVIRDLSTSGYAEIDITDYPNGMYILRICNKGETKEYKVLVD